MKKNIKIAITALMALNNFIMPSEATAITATPTLSYPANGAQDMPLNNFAFSWAAISGANFRIVISENPYFSGFTDAGGNSSCNATCITATTTQTKIGRTPATAATASMMGTFANYWWKAGTYYWRVRASTSVGGTSTWSVTRSLTTGAAIQRSIVNRASVPGNSPQSIIGSPWLTDMAGGDGDKIRKAIGIFSAWVSSTGGYSAWLNKGRPAASTTAQTAMRNSLYTYSYADNTQWIERIRAVYAGTVPTNDDQTLMALGIRAQCKEFADRIVSTSGGIKKAYGSTGVDSKDVSPGMYAFKSSSHAAIITAVWWDATGAVTKIRLAESNYGSGWSNPGGQVPWLRTIQIGREILMTGYSAVKTD